MSGEQVAADAFRTVALLSFGGTLFLTVRVVFVYARRYVKDARLARAQGRKLRWRGLLPLHVIGIGTSHILLAVVGARTLYLNLGKPFLFGTVPYAVGLILGAASLYAMLRWQRRIYPAHDDLPPAPPTNTGAP